MQVSIMMTVDIDPRAWADEYGIRSLPTRSIRVTQKSQ